MRKLCFVLLLTLSLKSNAQKKWDGGASNNQWNSAENWFPDGVPGSTDDVLLDNSLTSGNYTVYLPAGAVTSYIQSLLISPESGMQIICEIPQSNNIAPALVITGNGNALELKAGAIFKNSSGASSGDALIVDNGFRIENGARYIHHTARGNATLIDQLVNDAGTEAGTFEFDVPGAAGYTVSLTGNTFGNLVFSAGSGSKSYNGSGVSTLHIRGDLVINSGVTLTSSMTADIVIDNNLDVKGNFQLHPVSPGSSNRSLQFNGSDFNISGSGNISLNSSFNKIMLNTGSAGHLNRPILLANNTNIFQLKSGATLYCSNYPISGNGVFIMEADAELFVDSKTALQPFSPDAAISTAVISISDQTVFHFTSNGQQNTGTGFPSAIKKLIVEKPSGNLVPNKSLRITGNISLQNGIIYSSPESLLILSDCSITSPENQYGFTNQGWENSFINGPVKSEKTNSGEFAVPVGKENYYAPVRFNKIQTGLSSYTISYFPSACSQLSPLNSATLHHISTQEFWQIQTNQSSGAVYISLSWRPHSLVSAEPAERISLRIACYANQGNGNRWSSVGNAPQVMGNQEYGFLISDQPAEQFSFLTLGSANAFNSLPFRAISFKTNAAKNGIDLNWEVDDLHEILDFVIEKSENEKDFRVMNHIWPGIDNSQRKFYFTDHNPFTGYNFYRIGVRLQNDSTIYSAVSGINYRPSLKVKLYPNPAREEIFLFFYDLSSRTTYRIVRSNGSVVKMETVVKEKTTRIPIHDLANGYYSVIVQYRNELIALAFLKY